MARNRRDSRVSVAEALDSDGYAFDFFLGQVHVRKLANRSAREKGGEVGVFVRVVRVGLILETRTDLQTFQCPILIKGQKGIDRSLITDDLIGMG